MDTHAFLLGALVVLGATVLFVPVAKRLGLGSVLGYLAAGAAIGPFGLGLITDIESMRRFSELGVVLLMFIVGLELLPQRLWELRKPVFGYGSAQVLGTAALMAAGALALGVSAGSAVVVGLGLSLSSTAFALQVLAERNQLTTPQGRHAFAVLLFQDLGVIPMLAIVAALGVSSGQGAGEPMGLTVLKTLGVLAAIFVVGRYLLRTSLRLVASARSQEVFTAAALVIVFGIGVVVESVGMSMALGAFISGVLLADSDYRHELEADLEPFKGLLLGLFFVAVGMSAQLGVLGERAGTVAVLVVAYVALKLLLLYGLARLWGHADGPARTLAIAISQGGEFAFVLFALAQHEGVLASATVDLLVLIVILSMATTPLLLLANDRWGARRRARRQESEAEALPESAGRVVIAGFGRFGQIVGRLLATRGIPFTALDRDPEHIEFLKQFDSRAYFGDCSRLDLLRAAKLDQAEVFVLAIDDVEASMKTAELVRHEFPRLRMLARARNRQHAYRLLALGVEVVQRETFESSLELGRKVLVQVGMPESVAAETVAIFRQHDEELVRRGAKHHEDLGKLKELAAAGRAELESLFRQDVR